MSKTIIGNQSLIDNHSKSIIRWARNIWNYLQFCAN